MVLRNSILVIVIPIAIAVAVFLVAFPSFDGLCNENLPTQDPTDIIGESHVELWPYKPNIERTFNFLPTHIQELAKHYLLSRLSPELAKSTVFDSADIVDKEALLKTDPTIFKEVHWEIPHYILRYYIGFPRAGIQRFYIGMSIGFKNNVISKFSIIKI